MKHFLRVFKNGLFTGLILQLAIGPVFFYIINLALQRTIWDGFAGVLGVTIVDYIYITLAVLGIGKLLEKEKFKKIFATVSSIVLIIFGVILILGAMKNGDISTVETTTNLISAFSSVFLITISSPMTIVFFTSLFTTKALEYNYTKKELYIFGIATGLATFIFMGTSVLLFSLLKGSIPIIVIQILNIVIGGLIVGYGTVRLIKTLFLKNKKLTRKIHP